jgi:hypothetical protein
LFLFLLFALFRAILWRGGWGWRGGRGYPGEGVPSRFDEWHRRAHESNPETRNT